MWRYPLALLLLVSSASCVPVKTTYYEAVDRPRVAAATNGNLFPCPPTGGYGVGSTMPISVNADYALGFARVYLNIYVLPAHQLLLQTQELRLTSLENSQVTTSIPLTFYADCAESIDPARHCVALSSEVRSLAGGGGPFPRRFFGIGRVPSELVNGFLVTPPEVFDGATRISSSKPLRFERRMGVLSRGLGGCQ